MPVGRISSTVTADFAYEQRMRLVSENSGAGGGLGFLPSVAPAPYRIRQLDARLVRIGQTFSYRHEIDRAAITFDHARYQLTVGRQAVGWGRGVLFSAVDIFAPFTPLESDRDWRRGIDAVRGTAAVSDRVSVEMVAALGESADESAFMSRLCGYAGQFDGEVILGRRRRDLMVAATFSSPVSDAEVHGEFAMFRLPEPWPGTRIFGRDDLVAKAVLGGSYSLSLFGGLLVYAEYHYSGFGIEDIEDLSVRIEEEDFVERYLGGDTQILGRHASAFQAVYGLSSEHPVNLLWILSPKDGSGVVTSSVSWIFSDSVTLIASGYLPHGARPADGELQSEYGGTPVSGLVQLSFYF